MSDLALSFRRATERDLPALVAMLADDPLGATRERFEDPLPPLYAEAFAQVDADPNQELVVGDVDGEVVAMLQLTFIPGLSRLGSWRALIEAVRVHRSQRSRGVGRRLVEHAIDRARQRGCRLIQLTTDRKRPEAHAFYERLGFEASHVGMKRALED